MELRVDGHPYLEHLPCVQTVLDKGAEKGMSYHALSSQVQPGVREEMGEEKEHCHWGVTGPWYKAQLWFFLGV